MSGTFSPSALDELMQSVADCFTPEVATRIVNLRADPKTQAHLDDLADRNTAGKLSEAEQREYETLVKAIDIITILQAKARSYLRRAAC